MRNQIGQLEDRSESAGDGIVVGFDGSQSAWSAVRWAADEAGRCRAHLEVVSCMGDATRAVVDEAERVALRRGWQIHVNVVLVPGHPGDALVERSQRARMLVIGRHDPGAVISGGEESLSSYCRSHAACPVTVVTSTSQPVHASVTVS
jgi:nucleotide-binding universal stress UspA family protein